MAKVKMNLTLDEDVKLAVQNYAKANRMSVSAVITRYCMTLPTFKQIKEQMTFNDLKEK